MGDLKNIRIANRIIELLGGEGFFYTMIPRHTSTVENGLSFVINGKNGGLTVVVIREAESGCVVIVAVAGETNVSREVSHVPADKLKVILDHLLATPEVVE